jgi:hypothetical protein
MSAPVSRSEAVISLEAGDAALAELFANLNDDQFERRATIGGGEWSAKDLLGHVAAWEELALQTLEGWRADHRLPTDPDWPSTDDFNAQVFERTSRQSLSDVRSQAAEVHTRLVQTIPAIIDEEWFSNTGDRTLGERLGGLTGGPAGPFRHAFDHLSDLKAFIDSLA